MLLSDTLMAKEGCSACPIRHRAVCARCDSEELSRLEEMKYYRTYEAGQHIIWSGDRMAVGAAHHLADRAFGEV